MKKIVTIVLVFLLIFTTYSMGKTTEIGNSNRLDKLLIIRDHVDSSLSITSEEKLDNMIYEEQCSHFKDTIRNHIYFSCDGSFIHYSDFEEIGDAYHQWYDNEFVKIKSRNSKTNNWHNSESRPISSERITIYVDDDSECPGDGSIDWPYCRIQYAIDNATAGDNIFVLSGTYYENIFVDKSINIEGEDKLTTVIEGNENRDVVYINARSVFLSGFTIKTEKNITMDLDFSGINITTNENWILDNIILNNCNGISLHTKPGISLPSHTSYNYILDNIILNNCNGLYLQPYTYDNYVAYNYILENFDGIKLSNSNFNYITDNIINSNKYTGVYLQENSNNNIISYNNFSKCGLYIDDSYENIIENNTVNGKLLVYFEKEYHQTIDYAVGQVMLIQCDDITIKNQNLSDTTVGIQLLDTINCKISDNKISNNNFGIYLDNQGNYLKQSSNNHITNNTIRNNEWIGLYALYTSKNHILYNTAEKNNYHAIWLEESTSNEINNNICISNRIDGIGLLIKTSGNNCVKNICSNNEKGIAIVDSSNNNLIDNTCNNNLQGIMLNNADHCTVTNNKCYNNKMGIYLSTSSDNTMEYNNCSYSSWEGVALVKSTKNSLSRNVIKYNYYGVVIAESDNNQLAYNYISENTGIGIALMKTEGNKINNNDIFDNTENDLAGMICFDDAHRNYWGRFRPRFLREVVFLGWVRLFPWALFRYT